MKKNNLLFWQPKTDILRLLTSNRFGKIAVIILNYSIWLFLFFISYLLIRSDANIFWQLFFATLIGEIVEKYGKNHALWRRPLFDRHDQTPVGLVDKWYQTGSFPSGHTIKAVYFLLFIIQYSIFSPVHFLLITLPLLIFRIIIGFHYPIDLIGGTIMGIIIWLLTHQIYLPVYLTEIIKSIFNYIFLIH